MRRIGIVRMFHETNSYSPGTTELEDFQKEDLKQFENTRSSLGGVHEAARANGLELVPGVCTSATPGSIVSDRTAEQIMSDILASIDSSIDGLIVLLHGAMVAESYDDMEGELLWRIRKRVGDTLPIAVTLDLHANVSERMTQHADFLVGFDTYPHIDMFERAVEAVTLLARRLRGEIMPTKALSHTRMLLVPQVMMTSEGAMRQIMKRAFDMERLPGVLNITVCGGFPYSDVTDAGMSFLVTTDKDEKLARALAEELSLLAWELKADLNISGLTAEQAVKEAARNEEGPVILIEGSDNVGGGGPGDATHLLPYLLQSEKKSLIIIWDPKAASEAALLTPGETFCGNVGGHSFEQSGLPVWIEGTVMRISDGKYRHIGLFNTGKSGSMGRIAVVEAGPVTILLAEGRVSIRDIGQMHAVGIDSESFHIIVVKAAIAWKTAFGEIARQEIQVDTPGCCSFNLNHFQYKKANYRWKSTVVSSNCV